MVTTGINTAGVAAAPPPAPVAPTAAHVDAASPAGAVLPAGAAIPIEHALQGAIAAGSSGVTMAAPSPGNSVKLLVDEPEVLPELLHAIGNAKRQIDLTMFSLDPSGAGRTVANLLMDKARAGVEVNVQVDQVGSMVIPLADGRPFMDELRDAGVRVQVNDRYRCGEGIRPVDHRKVLAIDGTTFFTGGMNLSAKFGKWHDVMVRVDGPATARMGVELLGRWTDEGGTVSPTQAATIRSGSEAPAQGRAAVSILTNKPGGEMNATDFLMSAIAASRDRVWLLTPTLSNPDVVTALGEAAQRGVDVRVGVSGPEGWIGTRALGVIGSAFYRDLVDAGVKVYEQPGMSHAKVSLVDGVATVGSMNLTRRAMLWDHEAGIASDDPAFRRQVEHLFMQDFSKGHQVTAEDADAPLAKVARTLHRTVGLSW